MRACSVVHWQPRTSLMRNCITRKTGMSSCHAGQIPSLQQARRRPTRTPHDQRPETHLGGRANDGHGLCLRPHLARAGVRERQRAQPRRRRARGPPRASNSPPACQAARLPIYWTLRMSSLAADAMAARAGAARARRPELTAPGTKAWDWPASTRASAQHVSVLVLIKISLR